MYLNRRVLVMVCSPSLLLSVPQEGCASWLCHFLIIFTFTYMCICLKVSGQKMIEYVFTSFQAGKQRWFKTLFQRCVSAGPSLSCHRMMGYCWIVATERNVPSHNVKIFDVFLPPWRRQNDVVTMCISWAVSIDEHPEKSDWQACANSSLTVCYSSTLFSSTKDSKRGKELRYSLFSISRKPRDFLKYFDISVPRHIRFVELMKK